MATKITFGLSESEIKKAIEQTQRYKQDINVNCELFAHRLADEGVILAKLKIMEFPAIYTGELLNSISDEPGAILTNGYTWIIYTACPWAQYVEFGTGAVGSQNPHPLAGTFNWKYDVNEHGEMGWWYFKEGAWHWTKGMPSRPFLYETRMELLPIVSKIAREVFKSQVVRKC